MPALPPYIFEPIWQQFSTLLLEREVDHPLGCHRSRVPDRVVFDHQVPLGGEKGGRSPVDRGKRGIKRSVAVDARGIPLGVVSAPANRHDSPLLGETLDAARASGLLPEVASIRLDRGYDSEATRQRLRVRELLAEISEKGKPAPIAATGRWIVEGTNSS